MKMSRRNVLLTGGSAMIAMGGSTPMIWAQSPAPQSEAFPDLIVHNAKVTTLQNSRPEVQAFAVRGEKIVDTEHQYRPSSSSRAQTCGIARS